MNVDIVISNVFNLNKHFFFFLPTALYRAEAWGMRSAERKKVNVLEMKCLRSFVGSSRMDRVRNEELRWTARIESELASRADQRVLRWFGHVERTDEYRLARRVLLAEVSGGRVRGRSRLGRIDGVKVALANRDRKSTRLNSSHSAKSRMPSSA